MELGRAGIRLGNVKKLPSYHRNLEFVSVHIIWTGCMERGIQLNEALFKLKKNKSHNTNNSKLTVHTAS